MTTRLDAKKDYPLLNKRPEVIFTPTGKSINEISIENILSDKINPEDCRISAQTLEYQAQIADSAGYWQIANNFRRAAELTKIPDKRILEIYNTMRPYRSTKEELLEVADELVKSYDAKINAGFLRETVEIYEKREMFRIE